MSIKNIAAPIFQTIKLSQGTTLRYLELNPSSKPTLVLIHGVMVNPMIWYRMAQQLPFRCIMPELPLGAHAYKQQVPITVESVVGIMKEFVDSMQLNKFVLVGNDTGGALCQIFLSKYMHQVEKLVLTNCDTFEHFFPAVLKPIVYMSYVPGFSWLLSKIWTPGILNYLAPMLSIAKRPQDNLDDMMKLLSEQEFARSDFVSFCQSVDSKYTLEAAKSFSKYHNPVLLAWGSEDSIFPLEHAQRLAKSFSNCKLIPIDDAYFLVPQDKPEQLAAEVENFVKQ